VSFIFDLHSAAVSDLHLPCPCHAPTVPFFSRPQHSTTVSRRPCCDLEKNGMLWVNRPEQPLRTGTFYDPSACPSANAINPFTSHTGHPVTTGFHTPELYGDQGRRIKSGDVCVYVTLTTTCFSLPCCTWDVQRRPIIFVLRRLSSPPPHCITHQEASYDLRIMLRATFLCCSLNGLSYYYYSME
jgi:hypothetical protein